MAVSALGLDPGLGLGLHTDTPNRDSLALDVLEPVRPQVESWVLEWVAREPLRRADFFETATGNCRLMSQLCAKLSQTAPVWGKLVAPWAEYVARTRAKRTATMHAHRQEISNWKPSDLPAWMTRDVYVKQVQPALAGVAKSRIRSALGVSEPYSSAIQVGKCVPHPRHWQALARLVGVKNGSPERDQPEADCLR